MKPLPIVSGFEKGFLYDLHSFLSFVSNVTHLGGLLVARF
jgi:hypothetical protein